MGKGKINADGRQGAARLKTSERNGDNARGKGWVTRKTSGRIDLTGRLGV